MAATINDLGRVIKRDGDAKLRKEENKYKSLEPKNPELVRGFMDKYIRRRESPKPHGKPP